MNATKDEITFVLETMNYAADHEALKRVANIYFPTACHCEISQNLDNQGLTIDDINFSDEDGKVLFLPLSDGEALDLINHQQVLLRDFEQGTDPVEFLRKRYGEWERSFELSSTIIDDYVHFDLDENPDVAKPLYTGLPGFVVLCHKDLNENPDAHLSFTEEAALKLAAQLAGENSHPDDMKIRRLLANNNYREVLEHAAEVYNFVCDILSVT
jgi:hypothetical protein